MGTVFWIVVMTCGVWMSFVPSIPGWMGGLIMVAMANVGFFSLRNQKRERPKWCQCGEYDGV